MVMRTKMVDAPEVKSKLIELAARGRSQKQIAHELGLSRPTVCRAMAQPETKALIEVVYVALSLTSLELAVGNIQQTIAAYSTATDPADMEHAVDVSFRLLELAGVLHGQSSPLFRAIMDQRPDYSSPLVQRLLVNLGFNLKAQAKGEPASPDPVPTVDPNIVAEVTDQEAEKSVGHGEG